MVKVVLIALLASSICACKYKIVEENPFTWATADRQKILSLATEYQKKISETDAQPGSDLYRDRSNTQMQISQLEQAAKKKCAELYSRADVSQQKTSTLRSRYRGGELEMPRAHVSFPPFQDPSLSDNLEYQRCISEINNDQLIADLKQRLRKHEEASDAKRKLEEEMRKKSSDLTDQIISNYAKNNHFDVIVSNSPGALLFNQDKGSLDVTNDLVRFAQQHLSALESK